jgi:hypothetical protein
MLLLLLLLLLAAEKEATNIGFSRPILCHR